jgi:tRNA (cmo5U34)-methyltransferase
MKQVDNTTPHRACEYDKNVRATIPFYELFHSETIDLVKSLKPEVKIWLDTGCGTGYLVEKAFPHFPDTIFILADPSEAMLTEAKKRLQGICPDRLNFMDSVDTEGLSNSLSLKPEIITAIMCHHYMKPEKRRNATQACFNALALDGIYISFENIHPHFEEAVELGLRRWKTFQISQGRTAATVEEHGKRFNNAYFPITVSEHLDLLKKCGFDIAELFWYSHMQAGFFAIKRNNQQ